MSIPSLSTMPTPYQRFVEFKLDENDRTRHGMIFAPFQGAKIEPQEKIMMPLVQVFREPDGRMYISGGEHAEVESDQVTFINPNGSEFASDIANLQQKLSYFA